MLVHLKLKVMMFAKKRKSEIQTFPSPNYVQSTFSPWFTVVFVWTLIEIVAT